MCNCNQKRAAYKTENESSPGGMVKVLLVEDHPKVVNGDITGRMYVFRNRNDVNWVDKRDVLALKDVKGLKVFY